MWQRESKPPWPKSSKWLDDDNNMETVIAHAFLANAHWRLVEDYHDRIKTCVNLLSDDDLWWRPNQSSNSVGNLILHLNGNVRQWIIHGIGGAEDTRQRNTEFDETGPVSRDELMSRLEATLIESGRIIKTYNPPHILANKRIQGFEETVLTAIFHVVEHFSYHLGQIAYITKLRKDTDLKFFDLNPDGYKD